MLEPSSKITEIIVERIEASHPARAHFLMTELEFWPEGILSKMAQCGLLQTSDHAPAIVCPGCDRRCHKWISTRRSATGVTLSYIVCEEEPAHGLIFVSDDERSQYHTSLLSLAKLIAALLGQAAERASASDAFRLGTVNGRHGAREVHLALDGGRLGLRIGQVNLPLVKVLSWVGDGFVLDKKRLRQVATRKGAACGNDGSLPVQQSRSRATVARDRAIVREAVRLRASRRESWSSIAEAIASTDIARSGSGRRLSAARVRRIIADQQRDERK